MLEVCRVCGAIYEVVDEEDKLRGCPECAERRRKAEERSRRKSTKTLEEMRAIRIEKAEELEDPIQITAITFTVISGIDPNKSYIVKRGSDGKWSCDCPDFQFRRYEGLECKHIIKVKKFLKGQDREHREEARAKIEANHKDIYAEAGFYG